MKGVVKWFNPKKGFGFIQGEDGKDYFCHQTSIQKEGFRALREKQNVSFESEMAEKGPQTTKVFV